MSARLSSVGIFTGLISPDELEISRGHPYKFSQTHYRLFVYKALQQKTSAFKTFNAAFYLPIGILES
jgi:hypothetical protein